MCLFYAKNIIIISEGILHHLVLCFTIKGFEIHKILKISGTGKMLEDKYLFGRSL